MKSLVAGVDIGGTHITAALIDLRNRSILAGSICRDRVNSNGSADEIVSSWANVISNCFAAGGMLPGHIGIAMPGPFNYTEGIAFMKDQGKYDALYGLNVRKLLALKMKTSQQKILLNNDAACFLQGELFSGIAKNVMKVIGITLGTGLGSAITDNGKVVDANLWCSPFKNGIAEDYLSERGLLKNYKTLIDLPIENVKALTMLAEYNDINAKLAFTQFGNELGDFLDPLVTRYSTELVVLGGNISKAFRFFSTSLEKRLHMHRVVMRESILWEEAALIGAASMWEHIIAEGQPISSFLSP
jgi:glucokinase